MIITPPSSSNFNKYYATNLSSKLGVEYLQDFYQRNVLNVKKLDGTSIDEMVNDGIHPSMIQKLKTWLETAAIRELGTIIGQPLKDFINEYKSYFKAIRIERYSREVFDVKTVYQSLMKGLYNTLIVKLNNDVIGELLLNGLIKNVNLDKNIIDTCEVILNKRALKQRYQEVVQETLEKIKENSELLRTQGYKPRFFTKDIKITDIQGILRTYVKDYFVIAYENSKILIFDEDMNSGGTFKIAIDALATKMFKPTSQNTLCLANGYKLKGF